MFVTFDAFQLLICSFKSFKVCPACSPGDNECKCFNQFSVAHDPQSFGVAVMGEDGAEQCKFDNLTRPYLWDGNNTELPMYNPMQQYGDAGRDVRAHWHCRACALGAACVGTRTVRPQLFSLFCLFCIYRLGQFSALF